MIITAIQDKFILTKFSLYIKFHKELRESIVLKSYVRRLCKYNGFHSNI